MNYFYMTSPIGDLTLGESENKITHIKFGKVKLEGDFYESPLLKEAEKQLIEYFSGNRKKFDLPLNPKGTDFQKRVWQGVYSVPYGKTASYKDIAILAQSPKGFRAVGMANNKNPIVLVVP